MATTAKKPRRRNRMPLDEKDDLDTYSGRTGASIRERRKRKGLSRAEFADRVSHHGYDLSTSALQSYENGHRPIPLNAIPFFATALDISVPTLLPKE